MSPESALAESLRIQPSQLLVKDLQKMTAFYQDVIGLELLAGTKNRTTLGQGQVPILELVAKPTYDFAPKNSAGLFHNAIVFASRAALAKTILTVFERALSLYEGSADHLVSEAFYLHDPEGNGLELYFDRPRDDWKWINGRVHMDTLYLDPEGYILEHINEPDVNQDKALGHVHLRVGDSTAARSFYVDQLGFNITADMRSALFVSVGGYHHHIGMNTWMSKGAGQRDPSLGLGEITFIIPEMSAINQLANRLTEESVPFRETQGSLRVSDPWKNQLHFTTS